MGGDIRRERTVRAMSQKTLAALAGLHVRTIAKIEAGEINIKTETLRRIREVLASPTSSTRS